MPTTALKNIAPAKNQPPSFKAKGTGGLGRGEGGCAAELPLSLLPKRESLIDRYRPAAHRLTITIQAEMFKHGRKYPAAHRVAITMQKRKLQHGRKCPAAHRLTITI